MCCCASASLPRSALGQLCSIYRLFAVAHTCTRGRTRTAVSVAPCSVLCKYNREPFLLCKPVVYTAHATAGRSRSEHEHWYQMLSCVDPSGCCAATLPKAVPSPSPPASCKATAPALCSLMRIGCTVCFPFRHCGWNDLLGRKCGEGASSTGPRLRTNSLLGPVAILVSRADWMSARITRRAPFAASFFACASASHGGSCNASWLGHHSNKHAILGRAGEAPSTTSVSVPLLAARNGASTSLNNASTP
mmetsp:Transcript_26906/g.58703  ORF Transcript_26906/g.58703 Transcript_26906/m.58703 type:complete len:248 (-) Transcript_26906:649-1392(-)